MKTAISTASAIAALLGLAVAHPSSAAAEGFMPVSETTVGGVNFPESVAYDPGEKVLYVGEFVSELAPTKKDGQGRITKMSTDGEILEQGFLPAEGQVLDKPKGIWIRDGRLWVTDIDTVWEFDLATRKGREIALPGAEFANDPAIVGDALYVSDNRGDRMFRVSPAEFLDMEGAPEVTTIFEGKSVNPNGVYPSGDGGLLTVGFQSKEEPRAIFGMSAGGDVAAISDPIGQLDGIYRAGDGTLLVTDWVSGSLFAWTEGGDKTELASGFTGPADFTAFEDGEGLTVVVPDLVKSELRIVKLRK